MRNSAIHLVAHARYPYIPLTDRDRCADLWRRLRQTYPKVLACTLMPDHVHLSLETLKEEDARRAHRSFAAILREFSHRHFHGQNVWHPIPPPEKVADDLKLLRTVRYIHLNPCRERLARDPLEWEWSTHRDAVGAAWPCWIDLPRIARAFGCRVDQIRSKLHAYVSSDPSANVAGTPIPAAPPPGIGVVHPERVLLAAAVALRAPMRETRARFLARRLAVHLSRMLRQGPWADVHRLVGLARIGAIRAFTRSKIPKGALDAAMLVLFDSRLLPSRYSSPKATPGSLRPLRTRSHNPESYPM